jgi:hypothetical protein
MNRRKFVKVASLSAVLARCGFDGVLTAQTQNVGAATAPAEVVVSEARWLLRNGLVKKELHWNGKELRSQLGTSAGTFQGDGLLSDMAVLTTSGRLPAGEFRFVSANHTADGDIATLELHFVSNSSFDLTLHYLCRRGDAAIEQCPVLYTTREQCPLVYSTSTRCSSH